MGYQYVMSTTHSFDFLFRIRVFPRAIIAILYMYCISAPTKHRLWVVYVRDGDLIDVTPHKEFLVSLFFLGSLSRYRGCNHMYDGISCR